MRHEIARLRKEQEEDAVDERQGFVECGGDGRSRGGPRCPGCLRPAGLPTGNCDGLAERDERRGDAVLQVFANLILKAGRPFDDGVDPRRGGI